MNQKTLSRNSWIAFIAFSLIYLAIKFITPHVLPNFYKASSAYPTMDAYLGLMQEKWIGPVSSALSAVILLMIGFKFLLNASSQRFFYTTLFFLLATKFEILFTPPYGDPVGGPWVEITWLARNNLNFAALFHQAEYALGGPKVYLFNIYTAFTALLMYLSPSTKLFLLINHLINFILAAGIVTMFRSISLKSFDKHTALLSSLLLLSFPLFQSITEMLTMETLCTFFAVGCAWYLVNKDIPKASIMAILATFSKAPGVLCCAAVIVVSFYLCFTEKNRIKIIIWTVITIGFALLKSHLRTYVNVVYANHNALGFLIGVPNIVKDSKLAFYGYCFIVLVFIIVLIKKVIQREKLSFFSQHYTSCVMILFTSLWFALYINFSVMGPRYKYLLLPFILHGIIFAITSIMSLRKPVHIALIIAIIISFLSSYGLLYKNPIESRYYAYGKTERSLEYRNDLKLYMNVAREIETNFPNHTIGAPFIMAQALAFPELGYIKRKRNVVIYGRDVTYDGMTNFTGVKYLNIPQTIWIGFESNFPKHIPYPIDEKDIPIKEVYAGNKKATLFMGGLGIEKMYRAVLLDQLYKQQRRK